MGKPDEVHVDLNEEQWATVKAALDGEIADLQIALEAATTPLLESYACQRCGRRDGLDAGVTDEIWEKISEASGGKNLLCLWCMDAIAAGNGIAAAVMLHFAGQALSGGGGPTIWDEDGLTEQLLEMETRNVRLVRERDNWKRVKGESDAVIRRIVALVPRNVEREDIVAAVKRTVRERDEAQAEVTSLKEDLAFIKHAALGD